MAPRLNPSEFGHFPYHSFQLSSILDLTWNRFREVIITTLHSFPEEVVPRN